MISHHRVHMLPPVMPPGRFTQSRFERFRPPSGLKNGVVKVSPIHHVIQSSLVLNSQPPRHPGEAKATCIWRLRRETPDSCWRHPVSGDKSSVSRLPPSDCFRLGVAREFGQGMDPREFEDAINSMSRGHKITVDFVDPTGQRRRLNVVSGTAIHPTRPDP